MPDHTPSTQLSEAPLLADHLALDLLNTEAGIGDASIDYWTGGDAVLGWLTRVGLDAGAIDGEPARDALLRDAVALRACARALIDARKRGERGDPAVLNAYLALRQTAPQLEWTEAAPRLVRHGPAPSPAQALGEVAEAVAALLADGQFELVRQCEHPECVLWFYDRTKSHRRRWCSMALCGNRHKAAEFRKRTRAGA